ncbi:MAG: hypothetical protein ACRENB_13430 [Gemmatimonadales bacterium]
MPKQHTTRQKARRAMGGRRTAETPRGKRAAVTPRIQRKQRRGNEPRMRAGQ